MNKYTIMEVCGTHTQTAVRYGLRTTLKDNVRLSSGPGCPVCVTAAAVVDKLVELSQTRMVITFGDLYRVKGTNVSLSDAKSAGGDIRVVYSPFDVLDFAKREPGKSFVVAAVGFETTAPVYAALLERAQSAGLTNVRLVTALKTMPAAIEYICNSSHAPDGFILPGHVCAVTGAAAFGFLAERHSKPAVVAGFKPDQMIEAINDIVRQLDGGEKTVKNFYTNTVSDGGQAEALRLMDKYFEPCDAEWRGIGVLPESGLRLRREWEAFDAGYVEPKDVLPNNGECRCGDVMLGVLLPNECSLFGKACTPSNPVGACMVTSEGTCGIFYNEATI